MLTVSFKKKADPFGPASYHFYYCSAMFIVTRLESVTQKQSGPAGSDYYSGYYSGRGLTYRLFFLAANLGIKKLNANF